MTIADVPPSPWHVTESKRSHTSFGGAPHSTTNRISLTNKRSSDAHALWSADRRAAPTAHQGRCDVPREGDPAGTDRRHSWSVTGESLPTTQACRPARCGPYHGKRRTGPTHGTRRRAGEHVRARRGRDRRRRRRR